LITSLSKTTDQAATAVKPNVCPIWSHMIQHAPAYQWQ
jgi:hypothetical protein